VPLSLAVIFLNIFPDTIWKYFLFEKKEDKLTKKVGETRLFLIFFFQFSEKISENTVGQNFLTLSR